MLARRNLTTADIIAHPGPCAHRLCDCEETVTLRLLALARVRWWAAGEGRVTLAQGKIPIPPRGTFSLVTLSFLCDMSRDVITEVILPPPFLLWVSSAWRGGYGPFLPRRIFARGVRLNGEGSLGQSPQEKTGKGKGRILPTEQTFYRWGDILWTHGA